MSVHPSWQNLFTTPLAEPDPDIDALIGEQDTFNRDGTPEIG